MTATPSAAGIWDAVLRPSLCSCWQSGWSRAWSRGGLWASVWAGRPSPRSAAGQTSSSIPGRGTCPSPLPPETRAGQGAIMSTMKNHSRTSVMPKLHTSERTSYPQLRWGSILSGWKQFRCSADASSVRTHRHVGFAAHVAWLRNRIYELTTDAEIAQLNHTHVKSDEQYLSLDSRVPLSRLGHSTEDWRV